MLNLCEKYRPQSLDDLLGQPKVVASLRRLNGQYGGRAYWISGPKGTGKTSLALIIGHAIADDWCCEIVKASELTLGRLDDLERMSHLAAPGKGGRAIIVEEAHGLRRDVVRALKTVLESGSIPRHVAWIFTTTKLESNARFLDESDEDIKPLLERMYGGGFTFTNQGLAPTFGRAAKAIAMKEGLDGQPDQKYQNLVYSCGGSFRGVLARIEAGFMLAE